MALLFGQAGSDKSAFVQNELLPTLHRRAVDRIAPWMTRESGVVVPFPARGQRSPAAASKRPLEFIVYFDHWTDAPLAALQSSIQRATGAVPAAPTDIALRLSETLANLSTELEASFIIVLDRFEKFLQAPADRADILQFGDELVESITQARLPANFLISLDEQARAQLARLRDRIPGFDDCSLTLSRPLGPRSPSATVDIARALDASSFETVPTLTEPLATPVATSTSPAERALADAASPMARAPKVKLPASARIPVTAEQVYALIETTLANTANQAELLRAAHPPRTNAGRVHTPAEREIPLSNAAEIQRRAGNAAAEMLADSGTRPWGRGARLSAVIDWLARRLQRRPPDA